MATLTVRPTTILYTAQVRNNPTSAYSAETMCKSLTDGKPSSYTSSVYGSKSDYYYAGIMSGFDFSDLPTNSKIDSIRVSLKVKTSVSIGGIYCELIKDASSISSYTDLGDGQLYFGQNTSFSNSSAKTVSAPNTASAVSANFLRNGNLQLRLYTDCGTTSTMYYYDMYLTVEYSEVSSFTVNVTSSEGGTVTGGGTYLEGGLATLTATPNDGYRFVQWSDGDTNASRTVTVTGDATYTAYFEKIRIYIGQKKVLSAYCGTKKISIYCGTQKLI